MSRLVFSVCGLLIALLVGCDSGIDRVSTVSSQLVSEAPEAGMIAIAAPQAASVRVLYARNGGMVLIGEVRVPRGETITSVALSADGEDLLVDTDKSEYAVSTHTWNTRPLRVVALQRPSAIVEGAL